MLRKPEDRKGYQPEEIKPKVEVVEEVTPKPKKKPQRRPKAK